MSLNGDTHILTIGADFETAFLENTKHVLRDEAAERIATDGAPAYFEYAERRLVEEMARVTQSIDTSTEPKLKKVAEDELLATHMQTLIEMDTGLVSMLKLNKFADLRRMYTLLGRLPDGHAAMRDVLQAHLKAVGSAIVSESEAGARNAADPHATFVDQLLALRDEADAWLEKAFTGDKRFVAAVSFSFCA